MYVQYGRPRSSRISYPLPLSACVSFRRYRRVVVGEYTANRQPYEPHIPYQRSIEINININSNITDGGDNEPLNTPTTTTPLLKSTNVVRPMQHVLLRHHRRPYLPTHSPDRVLQDQYPVQPPSPCESSPNHPDDQSLPHLRCSVSNHPPHRTLHNPVHTSHPPPARRHRRRTVQYSAANHASNPSAQRLAISLSYPICPPRRLSPNVSLPLPYRATHLLPTQPGQLE